jgi:group I intron endonuclease
MVIIYGLKCPETNRIRYVGKTQRTLEERIKEHIFSANSKNQKRKYYCQKWIKSLLNKNLFPIIEVIETCNDDIWIEREKYWISFYKEYLTNLTDGGDGFAGLPYTQERKDKIAAANRGKKRSPEVIEKMRQARLGKPHIKKKGYKPTKQHCLNISNALRGKIRPEEVGLKISKSSLGKKLSNITKEKLRQCNLGKKYSLESKMKKSRPILQINRYTDEVICEYYGIRYAGEITGINKGNISSVCANRVKTAGGFKWKYKDTGDEPVKIKTITK